ncbi:MAG: GntR family transcriptional regulator [Faecalibacterium sp.]
MNGVLNNQSLIYQQIAARIEDGILRGEYPEEEQVPSTNEISRVFHINPATAAKGINRLVEEGLLYKKRGIGMFVAQGAQALLLQNRRDAFCAQDAEEFVHKAKKLGITKEALQAMIEARY